MLKNKGFTLIELMVSILILSILLAIAVPKYKQSVIEGKRAAMKADMMQIASAMERYKALQMTYTNATLAAGASSVYGSTTFPKGSAGTKILYNLSFAAAPGTTWDLLAVAANSQSADGVLRMNSAGQTCWKKGATTCTFGTDPSW